MDDFVIKDISQFPEKNPLTEKENYGYSEKFIELFNYKNYISNGKLEELEHIGRYYLKKYITNKNYDNNFSGWSYEDKRQILNFIKKNAVFATLIASGVIITISTVGVIEFIKKSKQKGGVKFEGDNNFYLPYE